MSKDSLISITDLTHFYGATRALNGVSIDIPHGAIGLVGQNGAGKSTIMQILLGMIRPTRGSATVLGYRIPREALTLRARVGYMPERNAVVTTISGIEYVALAGELCGMPRREALRRAHESLSYLDLEDARYRRLEQYSLGMMQRLKLAASLVHDPDLLLLDEPTSGLDPDGRTAMLELLKGFASRGDKSLLLSTHLLGDIERVCDMTVILDRGEVIGMGKIDELRARVRKRYAIEWRGEGTSLLGALPNLDVEIESADGQSVIVTVPNDFSTRTLFQKAAEYGITITQLEHLEEDLDSIYHRLVKKEVAL